MKARARAGVVDTIARFSLLVVSLGALVLLASVLHAALHDVSQAYDSLYYHVPFAAHFAGLVGPDTYTFSPDNQERIKGYALLAEHLQGALYWLTGRPEGANLLAYLSVPCLAAYLRLRHRVPMGAAVLALFALPIVQTHATSAYIDLPANTCAAIFLLEVTTLLTSKRALRRRDLVLALIPATLAAQMRFQLAPTVLLGLVMLAWRSWKSRHKKQLVLPWIVGFPIVYGKPLTNLVRFGNPVYPVELGILGHPLPFHETRYFASPPSLEHSPQAKRFLYSLLEVGHPPLGTPGRWTVDQYAPIDSEAYRMGGTFAPWLVAVAILLFVCAVLAKGRARALVGVLLALTVLVAPSPQSHEVRYYMVWPLFLVAGTLIVAMREGRTRFDRAVRLLFPLAASLACFTVAASTDFEWVAPSGSHLEAMVAKRVDQKTIDGIRDGETVCLWRPPLTFFYGASFHGRKYHVIEAEDPNACGSARRIE